MEKVDYKRKFKELYQPKSEPSMIDVPEIKFIQVDGRGNTPPDYFEYVMPPLEGLWPLAESRELDYSSKSKFCWTSMISQLKFVTDELFITACEIIVKKKPHLDLSKARLLAVNEGLCVQCMHQGSFDDKPVTLEKIKVFRAEHNLQSDFSDARRHHEIYLSDPKKINIANMKTILRVPVRRKEGEKNL